MSLFLFVILSYVPGVRSHDNERSPRIITQGMKLEQSWKDSASMTPVAPLSAVHVKQLNLCGFVPR